MQVTELLFSVQLTVLKAEVAGDSVFRKEAGYDGAALATVNIYMLI